jgi:hypothetical protein
MLSTDIFVSPLSLNISMFDMRISNATCSNSVPVWLLVHFVYSCVISIESFSLVLIILLLNQLRFVNQQIHLNPNDGEFVRRQRNHFIALIKEDMVVVFFYVLSAFLYTWLWLMKSYQSISWMYFIRWSIEATCIPFIVSAFYCGLFDILMMDYKSGTYMTGLIMLKLPVFFIMRYAETESIIILNRLQVGLFYLLCNSSDYYIPDHNLFNLAIH